MDILLLPDIFDNFRIACLEIFENDRPHFITAPGSS